MLIAHRHGCNHTEDVQSKAVAKDDWQAFAYYIRFMQRKILACFPQKVVQKAVDENDQDLKKNVDALKRNQKVESIDGKN